MNSYHVHDKAVSIMEAPEETNPPHPKRACRLCRGQSVKTIRKIKSPHLDASFTLFHCLDCGSRFFDPAEHPCDLEAIYDGLAADRNLEKAFQKEPFWTQEVERIRAAHGNAIERVLDVGCREGTFLLHWDNNTHRCGVELSGHAAEIARSRGLTIRQEALETATFEHPFDVVSCYAILEHLTDPNAFLSRLSELVAPGGILVILIPSFETSKARLLEYVRYPWHMNSPPEHLNFFSRQFLDNSLSQGGLELVSRTYRSGGMANPFQSIPLLGRVWGKGVRFLDNQPWSNQRAAFDHMYSTYKRTT